MVLRILDLLLTYQRNLSAEMTTIGAQHSHIWS